MKPAFVPAFLLVLVSPSLAQAYPNSLTMSCASLSSLVSRSGAVVIGTGPSLFDRYVSGLRYCYPSQSVKPAWVQSADNPQCFVGYQCRDRIPHGGR